MVLISLFGVIFGIDEFPSVAYDIEIGESLKDMLPRIRVIGPAVFADLFCSVAPANVIASTTGSFIHDDEVSFDFSLLTPETVTMRTSFAGGPNANGQLIAPGGFAPVFSLFDAAAPQDLLATDFGGTAPSACGARNIDPVLGFCLDAYLNENLARVQH